MKDTAFEKGNRIRRSVLGNAHVDRALANADEFTKPFQEFATQYCWGEIWGREGIDFKTRSVANIAMMVALNRHSELKTHVKGAIRNGLTPQDVQEILLQAAVYCGIPAAGDAFRVAREALAEVQLDLEKEAEAKANPPATTRPVVAFIGLGSMGYPMAEQLIRDGFKVRAFDLDTEALNRFAASHGTAARSAAAAVDGADVILTMLPDSNAIESLVLGAEGQPGILGNMKTGSVLLDMSSAEPVRTRNLAAKLNAVGIDMVDAPVSGGFAKAQTGELSIMYGGSDAAVAKVAGVMDSVGASRVHVGEVGFGHAVKALNNFVSASALVASTEALHIGQAFGLDPTTINRALNSSSGRNSATVGKVEQHMISGKFASGFAMNLMVKDVGIAMDLASNLGVQSKMGNTCLSLLKAALDDAGGRKIDNTEIYRFLAPRKATA